jgi:hypothetical protein
MSVYVANRPVCGSLHTNYILPDKYISYKDTPAIAPYLVTEANMLVELLDACVKLFKDMQSRTFTELVDTDDVIRMPTILSYIRELNKLVNTRNDKS